MSNRLAAAIVAELNDDALAMLAQRLAPYLPHSQTTTADGWMDSHEAASYLGITRTALHRLTAAREVPFAQSRPGAKTYFQRSELDNWRRGGTPIAPKSLPRGRVPTESRRSRA